MIKEPMVALSNYVGGCWPLKLYESVCVGLLVGCMGLESCQRATCAIMSWIPMSTELIIHGIPISCLLTTFQLVLTPFVPSTVNYS